MLRCINMLQKSWRIKMWWRVQKPKAEQPKNKTKNVLRNLISTSLPTKIVLRSDPSYIYFFEILQSQLSHHSPIHFRRHSPLPLFQSWGVYVHTVMISYDNIYICIYMLLYVFMYFHRQTHTCKQWWFFLYYWHNVSFDS